MKKIILILTLFLLVFPIVISCSGSNEVALFDDKGREWIELDRDKIVFNSSSSLINKNRWRQGYKTKHLSDYLFVDDDNYIIISLKNTKHLSYIIKKAYANIELKYNGELYKGGGVFKIISEKVKHSKNKYEYIIESVDGNADIKTQDGQAYPFKARITFRTEKEYSY